MDCLRSVKAHVLEEGQQHGGNGQAVNASAGA